MRCMQYVHTVYDRRYDNGGFNTLAVVYNYKRMKYEVLVVSDEKVGDKEIHIYKFHKQGFCHIKTAFEMKKLSAYTVASNCTDLTDIRDGIAEIHEAMKTWLNPEHIPSFCVSRLAKLETKKKKLEKRTQVHMTVTIRFFIDDDTLYNGSQALPFLQAGTDWQNVMKAIRDAVLK